MQPKMITVSRNPPDTTIKGIYRPCFVAEATTQQRDTIVVELTDLLSAGWAIDSAAYDYCQLALQQQYRPDYIVVKAKYNNESYVEALSQGDTDFFYITIESKVSLDITSVANNYKDKIVAYSGAERLTNLENGFWVFSEEINSWLWDSGATVNFESTPTLLESA